MGGVAFRRGSANFLRVIPLRKHGLKPVVDPATRLLILGSLPGDASLAAGQYYAHPRNAFWTLIGDVIGQSFTNLPYDTRLVCLAEASIGLWDVIASAERSGSLDAAIRSPQGSDLNPLISGLPDLRAVAFNGAKAAAIGRRILVGSPVLLIDLPSSSPAHARPLAEKAAAWSVLKTVLEG